MLDRTGDWAFEEDGTLKTASGQTVLYSVEAFKKLCDSRCCFICGTSPDAARFTAEHILPEWFLRHFDLFSKRITLPNDTTFRYDQYTLPCCEPCNREMGRRIEHPMREALTGGLDRIAAHIQKCGPLLLWSWMALVFLKLHLRDRDFLSDRDRRSASGPISATYDWETLHHLHVVARGFYTGATIQAPVFGTLFVLPARPDDAGEPFDLVDVYDAQAMLLRIGDFAIVAVFNDSGASAGYLKEILLGLDTGLSSLQLREVLVEAATRNLHLTNRPRYRSLFSLEDRTHVVMAELEGSPEFEKQHLLVRGAIMEFAFRNILPREGQFVGYGSPEQFWRELRDGTISFMRDESGAFIRTHHRLIPEA